MNIVSWNVNGLRSIIKKGALDELLLLKDRTIDILCLQETRCPKEIIVDYDSEYFPHKICITHEKPGYAGVAVLSKYAFTELSLDGTGIEKGRAISLDFGGFVLINLYVPNSKPGLIAQPMRTKIWEPTIRKYIKTITKPVIVVGDFNVAPSNDLDIYMPKPKTAHGASPIERDDFALLLKECSLVDTFRELYPKGKEWTWYSNFGKARENGNGWRIDMALVSKRILKKVVRSEILHTVLGSDHKPILLEINK